MRYLMLDQKTDSALDALAIEAEAYLDEAFALNLGLAPTVPLGLPHYLLDRYRLWQGQLNGEPLLVVAMREHILGRAATHQFIKHRDTLRAELGAKVVLLLLDHVSTAIRRQMVERHIGFIAPGAQLYIPEALIDLRERTRGPRATPGDHLSPTAQLLIIATLLGDDLGQANQTALAERYDVAIMSVSRALDELEASGLAEPRTAGRNRRLHLILNGAELWRAVESRLQSPVRKVRTVRGVLPDDVAPLAGESALAHYTMLAEPRIAQRALAAAQWKTVQSTFLLKVGFDFDDRDRIELETWRYDPRTLARTDVVDPISLYLSARHDPDERIVQAAQQLLEPFGW
jgi:DNA-binding MarR family transcriptional regulator